MKEASEKLKINYSTAKTIIRVYRKEKRIFKKCSKNNDDYDAELAYKKHKTVPNANGGDLPGLPSSIHGMETFYSVNANNS